MAGVVLDRLELGSFDFGAVRLSSFVYYSSLLQLRKELLSNRFRGCESGFDDYWSKRGRNLRQNLKRQRNRLERESVETRMTVVEDPNLIADSVDRYGALESAGWKGREGTSLHPDNAQGKFYRTGY